MLHTRLKLLQICVLCMAFVMMVMNTGFWDSELTMCGLL